MSCEQNREGKRGKGGREEGRKQARKEERKKKRDEFSFCLR
jgi:hypothetical protein